MCFTHQLNIIVVTVTRALCEVERLMESQEREKKRIIENEKRITHLK